MSSSAIVTLWRTVYEYEDLYFIHIYSFYVIFFPIKLLKIITAVLFVSVWMGKISYYMYNLLCYTVECSYNTVKFVTILHSALRWQWQNESQTLDSQKTPHSSPSRPSYRMSFVRTLEKIDCVITTPHCTAHIYKFMMKSVVLHRR